MTPQHNISITSGQNQDCRTQGKELPVARLRFGIAAAVSAVLLWADSVKLSTSTPNPKEL
jgi:hypothetical protein